MVYGYCRISRSTQNIERQIRNIKAAEPEAVIVQEAYTGVKISRPEWDKLLKRVKKGDTIIFDSVSRMSRNAEDGVLLYEELYNKGVSLVFLKEPHINTETYRNALQQSIPLTGGAVDLILTGVNAYLMALAREQIKIAFNQAEKEVEDLHQRAKEGIEVARMNGKQIGIQKGQKLTTKKSVAAKAEILKYSKTFGGALSDTDAIRLIGVSRNSYYKYKGELLQELKREKGVK